MSWTTITAADLNTTKLAPLVAACRSAALAAGQADPIIEFTLRAVKTVRRKVAACRTNQVDADTATVPDSLKDIACNMILRAAKNRLEIELTEDERKQWDKDDKELDKVASCEMPIDDADDAEAPEVQSTQPGPTISARKRRFGRAQQDGV